MPHNTLNYTKCVVIVHEKSELHVLAIRAPIIETRIFQFVELTETEQEYVVNVIMDWIGRKIK